MKIKKLPLMMLLLSSPVFADKTINTMTLDKATLFLDGAKLHAKTDVALVKGENEVLLTGISENIEQNFMQIGFDNAPGVKILSIKKRDPMGIISDEKDFSLYPDDVKTTSYNEIKELRDKKQKLEDEYQATEIEFAAVSEVITLLQGNHLESLIKNSVDITKDMKDVLDFVKGNLTTALSEQAALQTKLEDLNAQVGSYQTQIEQRNATLVTSDNVILLKVYSENDLTAPLSIDYTITNRDLKMNSGWNASYDVRVADVNSSLQLTYNANLFQSSGLDWHDIDLTLSTALVNKKESILNLEMPQLTDWQIDMSNKSKNRLSAKQQSNIQEEGEGIAQIYDETQSDQISSDINLSYKVNHPYTLKSQSYGNQVALHTKEINAEYLYLTTPKLDDSVFLQVAIPNWRELNLLPGNATLFFANNYVGEFTISPNSNDKNLTFMLGKDSDITVKRNRDLSEISPATGNKLSQKYGYTITVKNSKSIPISILVNDQLPVIKNQNILLDEAKYEGANFDKESGLLQWQLTLQPDETKDLHFGFKLTYPKDKTVTGL